MCVYICIYVYCDGRSKRQAQWVWRQASEGLLLNRNNKIKRGKSVQNKQGFWCPRQAAGYVKEGQCSEGRVQVRGGVRRPHTLPSDVRVTRGGGFSSRLRLSWPTALDGTGRPGILARQPYRGCCFRLDRGSGGSRLWPHGSPSTLPSWTHEDTSVHARKRPVSRGEEHSAYNSGGDEAPFTSGVPHYMPPDLAVSAPLLSHTPTPVGSLVKGGE